MRDFQTISRTLNGHFTLWENGGAANALKRIYLIVHNKNMRFPDEVFWYSLLFGINLSNLFPILEGRSHVDKPFESRYCSSRFMRLYKCKIRQSVLLPPESSILYFLNSGGFYWVNICLLPKSSEPYLWNNFTHVASSNLALKVRISLTDLDQLDVWWLSRGFRQDMGFGSVGIL